MQDSCCGNSPRFQITIPKKSGGDTLVTQHKLSDAEIRRKLKKDLRRAREGAKDGRIWLEVFSGSGVMSCKLGSALKSDGISFELSEGAHFDVSRSVVVQLINWTQTQTESTIQQICVQTRNNSRASTTSVAHLIRGTVMAMA